MLQGYRGQPASDIDALTDTVSRVWWLIADHAERLAEVEINPLMVARVGAFAVDAMVRTL
jgi:succinyl-CoA synthetase beta subunit